MANRKSAKIICKNSSFWTTPKQFWLWVRKGIIECTGESPLTGKYLGESDDFLVTMQHIVLNSACPEHFQEVIRAVRGQRKSLGRG